MENREEIFDRPDAAAAEGAPVESQPRQSEETSRKAMEGLRKAGEKLNAVAAVGGILSGILSFIFGIVTIHGQGKIRFCRAEIRPYCVKPLDHTESMLCGSFLV